MPPRPILDTLNRLWTALDPLQLPMALMGGLALSVWNHIRSTQDVDLLIGVEPANTERVLQSVREAGFRFRRTPPITDLGGLRAVQLEFEPHEAFVAVHVDLLLSHSPYQRQALLRRVWRTIPAIRRELAVLSCEDLILHKLLAGRMIDLADAVALIKTNAANLDSAYLSEWAGRLDVADALERVQHEAESSS